MNVGYTDIQEKGEFGRLTFHSGVFEKLLKAPVSSHLKEVIAGRIRIKSEFLQHIAEAMQQWAIGLGATHFCHWFQPLTGRAAEKQDAFLSWDMRGKPIQEFTAKQLMKGEPDASSFPSGGLRSTDAARGYTSWDVTSTPFIWEMGKTRVLCLPAVFYSWTMRALDMKIPLLRSDAKIDKAAMRLLALYGVDAGSVHVTLGCEQEYFLIEKMHFLDRPDLKASERTLWGAPPPKGQELEDHYFGALKERVALFMTDLEHRAWALGIPLKTRHNEVAPNQFETAPLFEKVSVAVDHNILLMELMRQVAERHDLVCLLHEKPFQGVNGSGKHCNWSLATDTGYNLLNPQAFSDQNMPFRILLTAVLHAAYHHSALIRASIATAGNDLRLGGHEAPPPILSIFLGEAVEELLKEGRLVESQSFDLDIPSLPHLTVDESDRNRTSPFPFIGTKFEFRAVGASQNPALPLIVLNACIADSLNHIVDRIEKKKDAAPQIVRAVLKEVMPICFSGDNYAPQWVKEAKKRKLPIIEKSAHAFNAFLTPSSLKVFERILTKEELASRVRILKQQYCKTLHIEAKILLECFHTQILPSALEWQKHVADSIRSIGSRPAGQVALLKKITGQIERALKKASELESVLHRTLALDLDKQTHAFADRILPKCEALRKEIDGLEGLLDDRLWPSPKYSEMLSGL